MGKFRWDDRLAVMFHHDAAWRQFLRDQKFFNRTGQLRRDALAVGGDVVHGAKFLSPISNRTGSGCPSTSINTLLPWISRQRTSTVRPRSFTCLTSPAANETPPMIARRFAPFKSSPSSLSFSGSGCVILATATVRVHTGTATAVDSVSNVGVVPFRTQSRM